MKRIKFILLAILLVGCNHMRNTEIPIWIENVSDMDKQAEVDTYIDDSIVDKRVIAKDSIADRIAPFVVKLPKPKSESGWNIKFTVPVRKEETGCFLQKDSLRPGLFIHTLFGEKVFRKGMLRADNSVLDKDTLYDKSFNCEVITLPYK